ncbi:hypothetical protein [Catenulispora rubra]|uniref:hypothetical protein n=1 Tax=Catenulispora rubra TaxID=280293 RepID=UPI00189273D9|nr:hypothetical protein [Catenulispora rubra]
MHASVSVEVFSALEPLVPGEAVVAERFLHPRRGPVATPAAALLAADLRNRGVNARSSTLAGGTLPGGPQGSAVVHAVTYLARDASAVGFAVAVDHRDTDVSATVREVVGAWTGVLRTRRLLLAAVEPACGGTQRALGMAARERGRMPRLLGPLSANPFTMAELHAQGAIAVEDLDDVPPSATVMFPAHGVPLAVQAEAAALGLSVVDATCPLVSEVQQEIRELAGRGSTVLLVGRADHAVSAALLDQAPSATVLVQTLDEADRVEVDDSKRVAVVVAPGIPLAEATPVVAALRSRFGWIVPQHPATYCYAASDRYASVVSMATCSEVVLVAGAPDCADARQVAGWVRTCGRPAHIVNALHDVRPEHIAGASIVGTCAATSAPPGLIDQLTHVLSGLGPLATVGRTARTDLVGTAVTTVAPRP